MKSKTAWKQGKFDTTVDKSWNNFYKGGSQSFFKIQIWRIGEVSEFLGCSKKHVYNLKSKKEIPCYKKGKALYFIPSEIFNWIQEGDMK